MSVTGKRGVFDKTTEEVCNAIALKLEADPATCSCFWGAQYLMSNVATGARIVFVPALSPGDLSVKTMSDRNAAKLEMTVVAYIWGASDPTRDGAPQYGQTGKGWGQQRGADRILADLLAYWHAETGGHANIQGPDAPQDTAATKYGETYAVPLLYTQVLKYVDNDARPTGDYTATTTTEIR